VAMTSAATLSPTTEPSSRLEKRKARTRAAILQAASALFRANGFEQTSMAQVAEAAQTGVGTVYGYFDSKDEILRELLRLNSIHAVEAYQAAVTADTPAIVRVCKALESMTAYIREHRSILQAAFLSAARDRTVDQQSSVWLHHSIGGLIRDGVARGQLRDVPVETTARMLISTYMLASIGMGAWKGREDDPQTFADLELITRAMLSNP